MDRDKLLLAEDKNFLMKTITQIFRKPVRNFKKELIKAIDLTSQAFQEMGKEREFVQIVNRRAGIKIGRIKDLKKNIRLVESYNDELNEKSAFGEWWDAAKDNAFNALAFYPMLTMFLELDKVIKGSADASLRVTLVYLIIWILVIAGKITNQHIMARKKEKGWMNLSGDWKDVMKGGGGDELYGEA